MLSPEVTLLKADQLNQIDTSKSFILWSHLGVGSCTLLMEKFSSDEYHVHRIISPIFSDHDLLSLPMVGGAFAHQKWLSDLAEIRASGKKLVLMFDEISHPSGCSAETFTNAIINRVLGHLPLDPSDIVLGIGRIDNDGSMVDEFIPNEALLAVEHYALNR